ncbi:MAG: DEAD/DEAH box helicase, partial [Candidatus Diapherotrites archaeon]|nr:DEAD/DEAH box helicase [Candidatus Diapherotrites archaeon]
MKNAEQIAEIVLKANGYVELNKLQKEIIERNLIDRSLVVSAPTASGKTLIAELFILNTFFNKRKKAIYICPLRALASEHFRDFKRKYRKYGIKIAISTGDFDSSSRYLSNYDVIFLTYEKLDSLQRHNASWLHDVA